MANNQNMDNDLIKELVDYFNGDYEQETTTSEDEKEKAVEQEYLDEPTYSEAKCNDQVLIYIVIDKSASMHSKKLDRDINDQLRKLNHFINDYMGPKHIKVVSSYFYSALTEKNGTPLYDMIVDNCKDMLRQYDELANEYNVNGGMIIFTDGEDNGSINCTIHDVIDSFKELKKRDITCGLFGPETTTLSELGKLLKVNPISEINDLKTRMRWLLNDKEKL
ncbi:unknown [Clostridium sp. CAG:452]|nr:unknown [Clostridium sp. CAG:452]